MLIWDCGGSNGADILAAGRARGGDRTKEVQIEEAASRTLGFGQSMARKLKLGRDGGKAHLVAFSPSGQHLAAAVRRSHKHRPHGIHMMTPTEMQLNTTGYGGHDPNHRLVAVAVAEAAALCYKSRVHAPLPPRAQCHLPPRAERSTWHWSWELLLVEAEA